MNSNAQRDLYEDMHELSLAATGTDGGGAALRRIAAERLAAHRNRRAPNTPPDTVRPDSDRGIPDRRISVAAQRVRDAVAARYRETSSSYRDVLATPPPAPEPQRVAEPQPTPAQVPAQTWIDEPLIPVEPVAATAIPADVFSDPFFTGTTHASLPHTIDTADGSFQVRPYADLPSPAALPERLRNNAPTPPDELQGLDEEIAFRLAPEFDQHYIEPLPIQANIIEFPRQLVAPRKQRPRLAEGPLRSEEPLPEIHAAPAPSDLTPVTGDFQMRIFEVDPRDSDGSTAQPADITFEPTPDVTEHSAPEWQNLVLDARRYDDTPRPEPAAEPELSAPPVARFELRLMSALVDAACIGMAFVVFATVAALMTPHTTLEGLSFPLVAAVGLALLIVLTVLYQAMFFTLGASTPGMYYAHLEFLTLAGRRPSRGLLRRRVTANLLAAAPAGIGLLWSLVDGRCLGWNDRLSGIFLREL